jgi:iron(III) transport system substrate-binding protein
MKGLKHVFLGFVFVCVFLGCIGGDDSQQVVIYTSRDQFYAEPVLKDFEAETGIRVLAVYDTGAVKTVGMVNRLIAEASNPQADAFWNSETARTIVLKDAGVLEPYVSPNSHDIPSQYKDAEGYWSGFGARARAIIYNTDLLSEEEAPNSIFDFTDPKWSGRVCVGRGWLGTMATHNAALFNLIGDEAAKEYFLQMKGNNVMILVGNTAVRDAVSSGECEAGVIDTSDAQEAISYGSPVAILYPDQGEDEIGVMIIPNTVALIRGGPNTENGKKFIDYMLSRETEEKIAFSASSQIPLRDGIPKPEHVLGVDELKVMVADYHEAAAKMTYSNEFFIDLFAQE